MALSLPRAALAAAVAALTLAAGAPAPAAATSTKTASEGAVTATLAYAESPDQPLPTAQRLTIAREGRVSYEAAIGSAYCKPCGLETFGGGPLMVRDLEGDGQGNVIVELNSGGAHCCTIVEVLTWDPKTMTYRRSERNFGDPGALVEDLAGDGRLEFETADDRYAYEFAPFAYSGLPLEILSFAGGRFRNVTRSFPAAIAKDAARWLRAFRSERRLQLGNGPIAAWAADEELLGHRSLVRATLAREAARGNLRSRESYGPSGRAFVRALLRFLARTGYRP